MRRGEGRGKCESWWWHEFCGTRNRSVTATALMKDWHRRGSNSQHVRVRGNPIRCTTKDYLRAFLFR